MRRFLGSVREFLRSEDGPTAVEYAVMLALVVIGCITAIGALGNSTSGSFVDTQTKIDSAIAAGSGGGGGGGGGGGTGTGGGGGSGT